MFAMREPIKTKNYRNWKYRDALATFSIAEVIMDMVESQQETKQHKLGTFWKLCNC